MRLPKGGIGEGSLGEGAVEPKSARLREFVRVYSLRPRYRSATSLGEGGWGGVLDAPFSFRLFGKIFLQTVGSFAIMGAK